MNDDNINNNTKKGKRSTRTIRCTSRSQWFIIMMEVDSRLRRFPRCRGSFAADVEVQDGLWSWLPDRTITKWLMPELQKISELRHREKNSTIRYSPKRRSTSFAMKRFASIAMRFFDMHGKVPTRAGLIDPITPRNRTAEA